MKRLIFLLLISLLSDFASAHNRYRDGELIYIDDSTVLRCWVNIDPERDLSMLSLSNINNSIGDYFPSLYDYRAGYAVDGTGVGAAFRNTFTPAEGERWGELGLSFTMIFDPRTRRLVGVSLGATPYELARQISPETYAGLIRRMVRSTYIRVPANDTWRQRYPDTYFAIDIRGQLKDFMSLELYKPIPW